MNGHERWHELIAADALASADPEPDDDRALLDHLVECAACRELYRQFRETAGEVALAAAPEPISATFEQRVLAVTAERSRPARARWPARATAGLVAASLAIVASLGVTTIRMSDRAQRAEAMLAVLSHSSARTAHLKSTGAPGAISLTVTNDGRGVMAASGLQVPAGKVLVLWLLSNRDPALLAVAPPREGEALAAFALNLSADFDALAITFEDGAVEKPTTDPIFTGSFF